MDFSSISQKSWLGWLARLPLKLLPPGLVLPVLQGPLRGRRWIVGSGVHGYWLGSYELAKRRRFEQLVQPGQVVYDIGAQVGYYSLRIGCRAWLEQAGYHVQAIDSPDELLALKTSE